VDSQEINMLCKIYAVLDMHRDKIIYTGPSIGNTAARLEPGCVYGWGPDVNSAREDVRRRAKEFNRDVKR
jgi:hypothetical protein